MQLIESVDQFHNLRNNLKINKEGLKSRIITNCFLSSDEISDFIKSERMEYQESDGCVLLKCSFPRFDAVYYFVNSTESVPVAVGEIESSFNRPTILEDLSRSPQPSLNLRSALTLEYLQRIGKPTFQSSRENKNVVRPAESDLQRIEELLLKYFNPSLERVPDIHELSELLRNDGIYLYRNVNGEILGVIIFEISSNKLHLRYWLTVPEARGEGVGSALMEKYFEAGKDTNILYLWVVSDNENAKKRYAHYGFIPGNRYDHIYELKH